MAYRDLPLKERHAIIKAGVANGVHKLSEIEAKYNQFVKDYEYGFDIDSFIRENPGAVFSTNPGEHLKDEYKLPNHPTFSTGSRYHSEATPGGRWSEDGKVYEPSDYVLNQQGGWNNFLRNFQGQEQGTGAVPVFRGGAMLPEVGVHPQANGGYLAPAKSIPNTPQSVYFSSKNTSTYGSQVPVHRFGDGGDSSLLGVIKHRLATNINPFSYTNPISRVFNAVVRNKKEDSRQTLDNWIAEGLAGGQERKYRLAAWSKYLGSPIEGINNDDYITKSQYTPRFSDNADATYYTYKPTEGQDVFDAFRVNSGNFTIGYGQDRKGTYYSLYDNWDINPFGGANSGDASFGVGNPFEVYDRIYYQDSPDAYNKAQTLYRQMLKEQGKQEGDNIVVEYKNGGSIHIAPSKRGTFTAAATKHGKSVQAFASQVLAHKENYSPAMVRKANFARNSAKWHSTGGPLYPFSFSKHPLPQVRYADGGFLEWLKGALPQPTDGVELQRPIPQGLDYNELRMRQAYAESGFDNEAKSNKGAVGMFQIRSDVLTDYNNANGTGYTADDLYDQSLNTAVRDWYMKKLLGRPWVTKGEANDSIQFAKALVAYNAGPTNTVKALNRAKEAGVDIYNGWDWLDYVPGESADYVNFILRGMSNSLHRSDTAYGLTKKLKNSEVKKLSE